LFGGILIAQEKITTQGPTCLEYDLGVIDTIVLGDINSDRVIDTAYVYTPPTLWEYDENGEFSSWFGCKNDKCYNKVTFSCNLPDLIIENTVLGKVAAIDDIDGDGFKELLFNTSWFTGTTTGLYLYHFNGKEWEPLESVVVRGGLYDDGEGENPIPVSNYFYKKGKLYYLKGITLKEGDEVADIKEIALKRRKRIKKSIKN